MPACINVNHDEPDCFCSSLPAGEYCQPCSESGHDPRSECHPRGPLDRGASHEVRPVV